MNDNGEDKKPYFADATKYLEGKLHDVRASGASNIRELAIMVHMGVLKSISEWYELYPDSPGEHMLAGMTAGVGEMLASMAHSGKLDQSLSMPVDAVYWTALEEFNPDLAQRQMASQLFFEEEAKRQLALEGRDVNQPMKGGNA